jgi:hypothetical protein
MKRILLLSLVLAVIIFSMAFSPVIAGKSDDVQKAGLTPTSIPTLQPTPIPTLEKTSESNSDQISFSRLGMTESTTMQGPYALSTFDFYLPASWKVNAAGGQLHLSISRYFSSLVPAQGEANVEGIIAGTLSVTLNGVPLAAIPLKDSGVEVLAIPVPQSALQPDPTNGANTLSIQWDASPSCQANLATSVIVNPDSLFYLPHDTVIGLGLDLSAFPRPFYAPNSPDNSPVVIMLPAKPTRVEMQAAMAIAAGLGRISQNQIPFSLLTEDRTSSDLLNRVR